MSDRSLSPFSPQPQVPGRDWVQIPLTEVAVDVDGGVYSGMEPFYLQPNQWNYFQNADLATEGIRRVRAGCVALGAPGASPGGLGTFVDSARSRYLVGVWGNQVYKSLGAYTWLAMAPWSTVSLPNSYYSFAQGECLEYHGAPTSATVLHASLFVAGRPWTGATNPPLCIFQEDGDATMQASYCPRAICWWQGRLWMYNLSNPDFGPNSLVWSGIFDGYNLDPTRYVAVDPNDGDEGMAIVPARGDAPRLYLFKKRAIHALDVVWGSGTYIPTTDNSLDTTNSRLVTVSERVGCVAPKTIVYTSGSGESDIFFLAHDGYRSLRRVEQDVAGGAGEAISKPIRDVMATINWSAVENAHAHVYDQRVYLFLPTGGSTVCNKCMVFDLVTKSWIGDYTFTARDGTAFELADGSEDFYLQWQYQTTQTLTGLGATSVAHVFRALVAGEYYDPSLTAIEYDERTRAFLFGDYGRKKRWNWLEYMLEAQVTAATLVVYAKIDEYDWTLVKSENVVPNYLYPILPAQLPFSFQQPAPQIRRLSLVDFPSGQKIQIRATCSSPGGVGIRALRISAWPFMEQWE